MLRKLFSGLLVAAGLLCTSAVWGQEAYTTKAINLRAGPDRSYPLVAQLGPGTPVTVAGCESDYRWCDVIYGDVRGWVYAKSLQYAYENRQVPIYGYGAAIGLPIVTFSLFSYWDSYYRGRPFYRDRPRWENRTYRPGPAFVAPGRPRPPQFNQPRPGQPQFHPGRPVDPQYRPPRPERPQGQPIRPDRPQGQPPRPERPQGQPSRPERAQGQPGGHEGNRPGPGPGGERRNER